MNNGTEVRGLRVLGRRGGYLRTPFWSTFLGFVFGDPTGTDEHWGILEVRRGTDVVASRPFGDNEKYRAARRRFVDRVTALSERDYAHYDRTSAWQAVLDAC